MLVNVLVGGILGTAIAYTPPGGWPPGQPYFTLYAMVSSDLSYGTWLGGYHDVLYIIQENLAEIGINLEIRMYDQWTIWSSVWEENWDVPSTVALPPDGWDITMGDWWVGTLSTIWEESFLTAPYTPPLGFNIFPWMNEEADELLTAGIHTLNAETRRFNLWAWQELFMHDPPFINLYYPSYYDAMGSYVEGYSGNVWFSTIDHLGLDATNMTAERKALGETSFRLGVAADMPNVMSLYMSGYTQSAYQYLVQDSLYMGVGDYNETTKEFIDGTWRMEPQLAADFPAYRTGPNGPYTVAIVPLRDDVWWVWANGTKSEKFDAYDVKFSIETVIDPATGSPAAGEWIPVIESVEVLSNATLQGYGLWPQMYEPYAVQINLKTQFGDLLGLLSMNWGAGMLPEHLLGGIPHNALRSSAYYYEPSLWCFTGPYIFDDWVKDEYVKVRVNPHYYGRNMTGIVDEVVMRIIPDDATRNAEMETNGIDAAEFVWAPVELFYDWRDNYPNIHVATYEASQSNNLMFNLNNPYLSNRYVRLAIAHAIDYERIYDVIKGWGIDSDLPHFHPGKTSIPPHTTYTEPDDPTDPLLNGDTVTLFNEELAPYTRDLTKARAYMDMWRYSLVDSDYTLGPIGDFDFSGRVDMDDFVVWGDAIVEGRLTSADWVFLPGNDIDPDADNTDFVELDDYYRWRENIGIYWPEGTYTREWSR